MLGSGVMHNDVVCPVGSIQLHKKTELSSLKWSMNLHFIVVVLCYIQSILIMEIIL